MDFHQEPNGPVMSEPYNRLKIALVTETFLPEINGVAMTLGKLVDGLLTRGHWVQLVRPKQDSKDGDSRGGALEQIVCNGLPIPGYGGLKFGLPCPYRLMRTWSKTRPDLVHVATEGPLGWSAIYAARKLAIPLSSSFHTNFDQYTQHYGIGWLRSPVQAYLRHTHNACAATLAPTQALANDLQRRGFKNVGLMARGISSDLFNPLHRSPSLRAAWGVGEKDILISYVGRLASEKNLEAVLRAFDTIERQVDGARLLLVGDGPLRESMAKRCPRAILPGMLRGEQLSKAYASSDLFLFASLSETYGNVVPEALASGVAVVAYAQGAAAELIRDGINGALIEPGNESAFILWALELAANRDRLADLRGNASASVAHLDWNQVQDRFINTLRDVIIRQQSQATRSAPIMTSSVQ
jgi:glycosyltransferase involved in cell wall biosynthesis